MKTWLMLVFFALGLLPVVAGDPPGYPRALIGRVTKIVSEGVVVEGVKESQLHLLPPPPGVDHECFAGIGGLVLVRGLRTPYQVGQKIEIMVTLSDDKYTLTVDPTHLQQTEVCDLLSESLAFSVDVDWDPTAPAAKPAATVSSSSSSTSSPDWSTGSLDDPIPGAHK